MDVLGFMNAYTVGRSGGDVSFAEVVKRWPTGRLTVVTSQMGASFLRELGVEPELRVTSRESRIRRLIPTYLWRTFRAFFLPRPRNHEVLYGSSDFFPDTLPILFRKLVYRRGFWLQKVFHLIPPERRVSHWAQRLSLVLIRRFADCVITINPQMNEYLVQQGFPRARVHPGTIGINFSSIAETPAEASHPSFDAIFLGRLHASKGIFDLVEIWRRVVESIPRARLGLIGGGDPDVRRQLEGQLVQAGLQDHVELCGYMETADCFSYIKKAKLFVFPSHEEGFGIAPLEAMACTIPVVAYNLPVYGPIFGDTMSYAPLGDKETFAQHVVRLLGDGDEAQRLAQAGYNHAKKFSWDGVAASERDWVAADLREIAAISGRPVPDGGS